MSGFRMKGAGPSEHDTKIHQALALASILVDGTWFVEGPAQPGHGVDVDNSKSLEKKHT